VGKDNKKTCFDFVKPIKYFGFVRKRILKHIML